MQKGYVEIELEPLAVALAVEKFHHFLYASHFFLETDQKPLEAILLKGIKHANTQIAKNFDQDIPQSFYCAIYTRIIKSASRLLVPIRWPKGHYQFTKTSCLPAY